MHTQPFYRLLFRIHYIIGEASLDEQTKESGEVSMIITCVTCGKPMERFRNKNTCSPECKRKLTNKRQAMYVRRASAPVQGEPTEEELREAFPWFYSHCQPIKWGKREKRECFICHKTTMITNGFRVCHVCRHKQNNYGVLAI